MEKDKAERKVENEKEDSADEKESEKSADEKESGSKKQLEEQNKVLKRVFIWAGILMIAFFAFSVFSYYQTHFKYEDVDFKIVKEGKLIFYNTIIPMNYEDSITGKHIVDYNFYIRNDPRKLAEDVPFYGDFELMNNVVINSTEEFNCDGDGVIAIANMVNLFDKVGATVIKDPNANCDAQGRYTFINIQSSDKTGIVQVGHSCYALNVNNCEILKATERFMIETFVKIDKWLG